MTGYLIITLLILLICLMLFLIFGKNSRQSQEIKELKQLLSANNANQADADRSARSEIVNYLSEHQRSQMETLYQMQIKLIADSRVNQEKITEVLTASLEKLMNSNERKLGAIEQNINEKLDRSLNERLDSSFKTIGKQLSELYLSLGELSKLTGDVHDLNKTLANVKTRGVWGEIQLERLLENILVPSQYDKNVAIKKNTQERVEFAVKIPDKDASGQFLYLPIDSKMPMDIYQKIADCSERGDAAAVRAAVKELEYRIKAEAKTIRDKYVYPPVTTDFAVLFLPTENLYAEVLRIPGLSEWCQKECKIMIAGPMTIAALLNSLQVGFRYLTVNKNSQEVLKLLAAIKMQYGKLSDLIDKTQKKLEEASKSTQDLKYRNDQIHKRLLKVEEMEFEEAEVLLGFNQDEF